MDDKKWFKAKRYGFGWTPCAWEGWLVIVAYLLLVLWGGWFFDYTSSTEVTMAKYFGLYVFLLSTILVAISYFTGEKARWRWGEDDTQVNSTSQVKKRNKKNTD
jgi:hypothetical protein